jgi:hypothetical protein
MRELSTELFASIVKGADEEIAFDRAIKEKMEKALEIHKVGLASSIFNNVPSTDEEVGQLEKDRYEVHESSELEEARNWWTVTITKKAGKLFKGQTVDVKATSLSDAIKKGLKQMKANPALVPSDAVDAELAESKFTEDLEEATLKKVEGSPANIQKDFKDLITNAKTIKGVTDDEYMRWYANMDEKIYLKWDKMVKAIPQYKKAYKLGFDGASDVSPFPKGTLASAIWSNEKAAGEMDA